MRTSFAIDGRMVGADTPVLIIAEAGVSHFGDMGLARELVDMSAEAGADVFKTQFFDVEALISKSNAEWRDRLRPRNLTLDQALELRQRCCDRNIAFMATAHDDTRIPWLEELDVCAIKVGSGERRNPAFLTRLAQLGKPMIVSTGMYDEADVLEAISACKEGGCDKLALLHCVTAYPTPPEDVNLAAMDRLRSLFPGPVGYSDHSVDFLACFSAVARGARIIEKHITILRDIPNAQDWKVSAGPDNFSSFIADIRRIEQMIGHGRKEPAPSESPALWAQKSLVAARDLAPGHVLAPGDLAVKRPGGGIPPNRLQEVMGRRLSRPLETDACLTESHFSV